MVDRRLLLIRHCQSSGQSPGAGLTELGFTQAHALVGFLSAMEVDAIVSSVYTRARQSIEPFAAVAGLPVHTDPRLNERTLSEVPLENWRELVRDSFDDLDLRAAGGESAREVLERAWACLGGLLGGGHRLPLAVTHGNLLSLVLSSLKPSFGYRGWESLSNPDAFLLQKSGAGRLTFERLWNG
ncbi:MAG: histidine phosphatase family protein [Chloroflexi bacterium]|nr:histidine phosphatase family protein [Chloroflexota bacterium]